MKKLPRDPNLLTAAALAALFAPALRERDVGAGGHDPYFAALQSALKRAGVFRPVLVIDLRRLAGNIAAVRQMLGRSALGLRIVTKSLQAPGLLASVMAGTGSDRLMVFNGVMLEDLVGFRPQADVLLGRPLPAAEVADFVRRHGNSPAPVARPQWLVDGAQRLRDYAEIARSTRTPMRISLEIDVGLHRGGHADLARLAQSLEIARAEPMLTISGLMGYDAQIAHAPAPASAAQRIRRIYEEAIALVKAKLGEAAPLTFNTAGSLTFPFHLEDTAANEVSIGSAFVKPANFDSAALATLSPALFIAEPVLKTMDPALYPGREDLAEAIRLLDPNSRRGFFLYGGYGDARPVSPAGLKYSGLYGGRAMLSGSDRVDLAQDDFVFMRPRESEGSLLQFGDIAVYDGEEIGAWWPTFRIQA